MMPTFFYILVKVYTDREVKLCGSLAIEAVIDVMKAHMRDAASQQMSPAPAYRIESVEVLP